MMDANLRISQIYELQRVALINVNYYAARVQKLTRANRIFQFITTLASSGTIAAVTREVAPGPARRLSIAVAIIAAVSAAVVVVFNLSEAIGRLERMHAAYKMLYHSAEMLAKQLIGGSIITPEQEAVATMLEMQLASLGPQDELGPDKKLMEKAQAEAEQQLPVSYYYPENAERSQA
jgi:hypothetical protein